MRVLFDQATPLPIRAHLDQHVLSTAFSQGWDTLKNGELLRAAERAGFDVLLTTGKSPSWFSGFNNGPSYGPMCSRLLMQWALR